ncbi:putative MYG1 protein [Babesia divergens]|uniref:MYG1 protein n=1 Tax=Babesia divergens TaxID=32595 RepID=A0AAD9LFA5_BABDI|nr:putative MYG1 protein [Babesia divergens]
MKICTHNGNFHCDEALAVSLIKLLPEFRDATVIRTRDPATIDACDIVVDVGSSHDVNKLRFDHHQTEFDDYFDENHTVSRLSSAGLVYRHFGKRIFREVYGIRDDEQVEELYQRVYDDFIEALDAIDNGVPIADAPIKYKVTTDLSSRIGRLNPSWVDADVDPDARFQDAMKLAISEFDHYVRNIIDVSFAAKKLFLEAYNNRFDVHESGLVIETPRGMPFTRFMHEMEEKESIPPPNRICFYVTYEKATGQWRASCTKDSDQQFKSRMPFPERLCGLRDEELEKASNIPGLTFIHRAGFTCGGKTKVGSPCLRY